MKNCITLYFILLTFFLETWSHTVMDSNYRFVHDHQWQNAEERDRKRPPNLLTLQDFINKHVTIERPRDGGRVKETVEDHSAEVQSLINGHKIRTADNIDITDDEIYTQNMDMNMWKERNNPKENLHTDVGISQEYKDDSNNNIGIYSDIRRTEHINDFNNYFGHWEGIINSVADITFGKGQNVHIVDVATQQSRNNAESLQKNILKGIELGIKYFRNAFEDALVQTDRLFDKYSDIEPSGKILSDDASTLRKTGGKRDRIYFHEGKPDYYDANDKDQVNTEYNLSNDDTRDYMESRDMNSKELENISDNLREEDGDRIDAGRPGVIQSRVSGMKKSVKSIESPGYLEDEETAVDGGTSWNTTTGRKKASTASNEVVEGCLMQLTECESRSSMDELSDDVEEVRKLKKRKKFLKKIVMPLLISYKLKFFALVPVLVSGLVLLVGSTGLAGFFFALFAAVVSIKHLHQI